MEKPRPRSSHLTIIDQPKLKSPLRYMVEGAITMAFWALGVYWLAPILTVLLWFVGIKLFYEEIFPRGGIWELISILKQAGMIFLLINIFILAWTYYNYLWFLKRGERRNKKVMICHDEDFAQFFNIEIEHLRKAKTLPQVEVMIKNNHVILNC